MQLILEQQQSNSILVRTNQLQNLFYKFNFTIFIYNSTTNKIYMHGTDGIQIPYRPVTSI